jgi:hypothetical protein
VPISPRSKTAGALVAIIAIVLVLVLLITPMVQSALFDLIFSPFQRNVPASVTFEVQRDIIVSANGGSIVNFTLDVPVIPDVEASGHQMQSVLNVSYSPQPTSLSDRYGVDWAVWRHGELSGEQSYRARMVYEMRVEAVVWGLDSSLSANLTDLPGSLTDRYLLDEWKIIVSDPKVQSTASKGRRTSIRFYSPSMPGWWNRSNIPTRID